MQYIKYILMTLFILHYAETAKATVYEFGDDGSVTVHRAKEHKKRKNKFVKSFKVRQTNSKTYDLLINKYAIKYGVPVKYVHAVISVESAYNPQAISPVGAQGLMQLMPATAKRFGVKNPFIPSENIEGGTKYLSFLFKRYDGDQELAFAAYNAGEGAVDKYGGIPPYKETINYVDKLNVILGNN